MRRVMKWVLLTAICVLLTAAVSCHKPVVTGIKVSGGGQVAVDSTRQLSALKLIRLPADMGMSTEALEGPLAWIVQPSDGASVSSTGVFRATKPGTYTVIVEALGFSDTTEVRVIEAPSSTTTERSDEEEPTSTENGSTTTAETVVTNPYSGTYRGTFPFVIPTETVQVAWEFTVDGESYVKGGWQYSPSADLSYGGTFSGQVSEVGRLTASGSAAMAFTVAGKTQGGSQKISLTGDISGEEFAGTLGGADGSMEVTANRQ